MAELVEGKEMLENLKFNNAETEAHIAETQRLLTALRDQDVKLQKDTDELQNEVSRIHIGSVTWAVSKNHCFSWFQFREWLLAQIDASKQPAPKTRDWLRRSAERKNESRPYAKRWLSFRNGTRRPAKGRCLRNSEQSKWTNSSRYPFILES